MTDLIDQYVDETIDREGGYVDHPNDRGGPTKFGITEVVARRNGYVGPMMALTRDKAKAIYRQEYAIKPGFMAVAEIYPKVGFELFDSGVNFGPARPSLWLQEWLNALNGHGRYWRDVAEDGRISPNGETIKALRSYKAKRGAEGEIRLLAGLNASQAIRYKEIARADETQEDFVYGWLGRTL